MSPATCYDAAKRLLWPHIAVPLAVVVALSYLELVSGLARVACIAYACLQFVAFGLGVWGGMLVKLDGQSPWGAAFGYNLARCFPLLSVGSSFAQWALTESPKDVTPAAPEGPAEEAGAPEETPGREDGTQI